MKTRISISFAVGVALSAAVVHAQTAGLTTPGSTSYPNGAMRKTGKIKFVDTIDGSDGNVRSLYGGVYDSTSGYALFSTAAALNPARVIKVDLNGAVPVQVGMAKAAAGDVNLDSSAIDMSDASPGNHVAYLGTTTTPGHVVRVQMGSGSSAPVYLGTTILGSGENSAFGMLVDSSDADPLKRYAYADTVTSPGIITRLALNVGAPPPTETATVVLPSGENALRRCFLDSSQGTHYAFFATIMNSASAFVTKVKLGEGTEFKRIGSTTFNAGEAAFGAAVIDDSDPDPANHYGYLGTYIASSSQASVVKFSLGVGDTPPTRIDATAMNPGERELSTGVSDPAGGYAYFGCDHTHPARVYKVRMTPGSAKPVDVAFLALDHGSVFPYPVSDGGNIPAADADSYGEIYLQSSVIDRARGFIAVGTDTLPGQVVKITISHKGYIEATRAVLAASATVNSVRFYSHTAKGNLRLAIYDDAATKNLLWQSGVIANGAAGAEVVTTVASGSPTSLVLSPGNYWLAWQTDCTADIGSYTAGVSGDGFYAMQAFGAFPATLAPAGLTSSAEKWTEYFTYSAGAGVAGWIEYDKESNH